MNSQSKKIKTSILSVIGWWIINNIILLPIVLLVWCPLALIDAFLLLFSSDNWYHRFVKSYYNNHVKTRLTNKPLSRTSFSVTHGFLYVIAIFIAVAWGVNKCSPSDKIIKTKFITINVGSDTGDSIDYFYLYIRPDWSLNKDSLDQTFELMLLPSERHPSDTAKFVVDIETNFDMRFRSQPQANITDSVCDNHHSRYNLHYSKEDNIPQFRLFSDVCVLNDPETPYVNLYIKFNRCWKNNALMPLLTDSTLTDSVFLKKTWNDKRGRFKLAMTVNLGESREGVIDSILPYDIVSIKPEPMDNSPFHLYYKNPENYLEVIDKGLYISVVNRDLENELEHKAFFNSVLIGALISIIFTLLLALFDRWRKMNEKYGREDPFE